MTREQAIKELISVIPIGRTQNDRYIEALIKVIKSNPTLEEVKQEWEALGYEWLEDLNYITLKPTLSGCWISIDKKENNYLFSSGCVTFKIHQLLTKTFRALGWKNV